MVGYFKFTDSKENLYELKSPQNTNALPFFVEERDDEYQSHIVCILPVFCIKIICFDFKVESKSNYFSYYWLMKIHKITEIIRKLVKYCF